MKQKILLLALFALMCGTKMYAQTSPPCAPYASVSFPQNSGGGTVCVTDICISLIPACYNIPACGSGGETLCLSGTLSTDFCTSCGSGTPATTIANADGDDGNGATEANPCIIIQVTAANGISDTYTAYWDKTSSEWYVKWESVYTDHHYTIAGFTQPDFLWYTNTDGSLYFYLGSPNVLDDESTMMVM